MNGKNKEKKEEKYYQFWLHNLPGIGDRTIQKLLREFGSEKAVYEADEKKIGQIIIKEEMRQEIRRFSADWDLQVEYGKLEERGIGFLTYKDETYPSRLKKLKNPPYGLYYLGNLPREDAMAAAIIGARECSEYGKYVAEAFAGKLAKAGIAVVSGMARGIDGIAQQAAVGSKGATFAVLGSGVDVCYPASNRHLYEEILRTGGGILSVFPPGTEPQKRNFPERNRIVAGLADILLVVEARQKSGTWITVDMALEQGKNVYAVPGRLTDRLSDGCNLLIRQGAGIALSPEDLLQEMRVLKNRQGSEDAEDITDTGITDVPNDTNDTDIIDVTNVTGITDVTNVTNVTNIISVTNVTNVTDITDVTNVPNVTDITDVGEEMPAKGESRKLLSEMKTQEKEENGVKERELLQYLDFTPRTVDEILERMGKKGKKVELSEILADLTELCMEGKVKQVGGYFVRVGL